MAGPDDFALSLQAALLDIHVRSSEAPIRFPSLYGAFPTDTLLLPPPIVPDASRLRDDILYACSHKQRTTLVTAANAGLLRLFCAQHVIVDPSVERVRNRLSRHVAERLMRAMSPSPRCQRLIMDSRS